MKDRLKYILPLALIGLGAYLSFEEAVDQKYNTNSVPTNPPPTLDISNRPATLPAQNSLCKPPNLVTPLGRSNTWHTWDGSRAPIESNLSIILANHDRVFLERGNGPDGPIDVLDANTLDPGQPVPLFREITKDAIYGIVYVYKGKDQNGCLEFNSAFKDTYFPLPPNPLPTRPPSPD